MADISALLARLNHGLGVAANVIGRPVTQYRPTNILAPLESSAMVGSLMAAFDAEASLQFTHPEVVGKSLFYLLADASNLQVGDYLVGAEATYFVASAEDLRPAVVLRTNALISMVRPVTGAKAGLNPPGGDSLATEVTLFAGFPGSVLLGGRGERGEVNLAGDLHMGSWQVLLPAIAGVQIRGSDILVDHTGLRRVVSSAELSVMGWRIQAIQETA